MNIAMRNFEADFRNLVADRAADTAIIYNDAVITYKDLDFYIEKMLLLFNKMGICQGDVILSLLPNSSEALICFLATLRGGYGYAPLPCHATEREIKHWINLTKPTMCIKKENMQEDDILKNMVDRIVNIKCDGKMEFLAEMKSDGICSVVSLKKNPRLFLSTSGTTGEAKAMAFDGNVLWSSGYHFGEFYNLKKLNLRIWNYLPISYLGGLFNLCLIPLAMGGSIVITEPFNGKTFLNFWQTVAKYEINSLWFVPTIIKGLLSIADIIKHSRREADNIKIAFLGTAPIDLQTKERFEKLFKIRLFENFALSETTFFAAETEEVVRQRKESCVGSILPYTEVKIEKMTPYEEWGEIKVKTPFLFLGYLDHCGKIYRVTDEEGFFATGDHGYINEQGLLFLKGRREDVIKKGGLFVSLREIEALVNGFPEVDELAAVRVPHEFYGESYVLFAKARQTQDSKKIKEQLEFWLHSNLVKYKWPQEVVMVDNLIKTSSGKIKKGALQEQYEQKIFTTD